MTGYTLTVSVPDRRTFDAYWYGIGQIYSVTQNGYGLTFEIDYGTDQYRAQYQADRFASGLYFATVYPYDTDSSFDCDYCGDRHSPSAGYPETGCPSAERI